MADVRVIEGDSLSVLPTLEAGSFDAVVTDPPYGQTNEAYDSPVAFDPAVWRECYRVCGPDAALLAFAGSATYHRIASAVEDAGWRVRQMWGWVYRDGMMTTAYPNQGYDRLAPAMDPIVFATKGKVLLRLERHGPAWVRDCEAFKGYSARARVFNGRREGEGSWPRAIVSDGSPPFEYFDMARAGRKPDGISGHPNQKPMALMRWLCGKLPPGAILDPFAGSGTTLLAAAAEGHAGAVGVEVNPAYCAIARRRLAEAQGPLFAAPPPPDAAPRQGTLFAPVEPGVSVGHGAGVVNARSTDQP